MENYSNPFRKAVKEKLGGITATARLIQQPVSRVKNWFYRDTPNRQQLQAILNAAHQQGIDVTPADFFTQPEVKNSSSCFTNRDEVFFFLEEQGFVQVSQCGEDMYIFQHIDGHRAIAEDSDDGWDVEIYPQRAASS